MLFVIIYIIIEIIYKWFNKDLFISFTKKIEDN